MKTEPGNVILYDGDCCLCQSSVRFLHALDHQGHLYYAPLSGETAARAGERLGFDPLQSNSVIFIENFKGKNEAVYQLSDAVLRALHCLGWPWRILSWAGIVPRSWRDRLYGLIARNRKRLFGEDRQCELPEEEMRRRLLP